MRYENLLGSIHNEVAAVVINTFSSLAQKFLGLLVQNAVARVEHNRYAEEGIFSEIGIGLCRRVHLQHRSCETWALSGCALLGSRNADVNVRLDDASIG